MSSSDRKDEAADEAAAAHRCNDEGKKNDRRDDRHSCFFGPVSSPPCFVTAVLRRGEKLGPAKKTPQKSVKLKVSSSAKQTMWPMDLEMMTALMTAETSEPKVGESFNEKRIPFLSNGSRSSCDPMWEWGGS